MTLIMSEQKNRMPSMWSRHDLQQQQQINNKTIKEQTSINNAVECECQIRARDTDS